ncbi:MULTISPECIES: hypothetical protein [unclassified Microbacterium]|uniref:hypothetical protein n=1 Tax=unclassified Microbacterium TaxID=2609290 RepID=UPI0006F69001|nr:MULTISPECIES: hypothetical protein [unclassified Microbacterium]AOX46558.1 hypothetical protein BJP65_12720 [Microbacterium sp. BH-3-3-3]KQR86672.1 hypothetical protein ASF96_10080 [Microbacterium sp. Leaf179]MBD8219396.1 hypothetical protein [Microbacterium sp. CFBP 13617]MBD8479163.1 hypothetical protein [Microbacterium sp. CFBP 8794]
MDADEPIIPLPTAHEKEVNFLARSGAVVTLRLMDTGRFEVKLDTRGDYTAVLLHDGETFELHPAPGVRAIGGTGLTATDLYERF